MPYSSNIDQDGCFRSNNKTGYLGVSHQGKRFKVSIYNGVYDEKLGVFDTIEQAAHAYKDRRTLMADTPVSLSLFLSLSLSLSLTLSLTLSLCG